SGGVGYINTDITLTLARMPAGAEIGLEAADHVAHDGIAVGTATIFDRSGPLGTSVVTALSNARRAVDFTEHRFDDDGNRLEAPPGV
ncbi:MAG: thioesterase family protein, partial [Nocardioides sp.]|nr:thioesterase family protein [Nocardioides sp.]